MVLESNSYGAKGKRVTVMVFKIYTYGCYSVLTPAPMVASSMPSEPMLALMSVATSEKDDATAGTARGKTDVMNID
jgi:hypothetical protein